MESSYDAIIVGGGVGGTAIGALLAHRGRKVLLLDKNKTIGGRCTSYTRDGFIIDLGVHLFGVADHGSLGQVCRQVSRPEAIHWLPITNPVLRYKDEINSTELAERLRAEEDVLIVPGDHFGMDRYIRIGYGVPARMLNEGLERLRNLMDRL